MFSVALASRFSVELPTRDWRRAVGELGGLSESDGALGGADVSLSSEAS